MKKLSLKLNLGIAIGVGVAVILAVVIMLLLRFIPIGYLDFDALALTDSNIATNLKNEELAEEDKILDPAKLPVLSPLFERAGAIFGGEEKIHINSSFPIYTDDSAVLMFLSDEARLISEDLERTSTYRNLYISDGVTFNSDRERADTKKFTLLSVSGGVYINLSKAEVNGKTIPMNSPMYFTENHIAFYKPQEQKFIYDKIEGLNETTKIKIGDKIYNYYDLLRNLGILGNHDGLHEEEPSVDEPIIEPVDVPEVVAGPAPPGAPKPAQPASAPLPASPAKAKKVAGIHLSPAQCYIAFGKLTGYMTTRLSIYDPENSVTSDINVYLYKGDELISLYTMPRSEFTGKGEERTFRDIRVNELVRGEEYTLYGTYEHKEDGETKTVIFDKQTFIFERPQTNVQEPPIPEWYVRPTVKLDPYTSEPYFINGYQHVTDPVNRIKGGVQYEIYRLNESSTKVFMRKAINGTNESHLGILPPGEPYLIKAYYDYLNDQDVMMRVDLGEVRIDTLPLPTDAKLKLNYAEGDIFSSRLQFVDVSIDNAVSDSRLVEAATRICLYAKNKNDFMDQGKEYLVNTINLKAMKSGDLTLFETANALSSRTTFTYEWRVYDPFGNQLPLISPFDGESRTSSQEPIGSITVTPKPGDTEISVRITNPENVSIHNGRLVFYELVNGIETQVSTQAIVGGNIMPSAPDYTISPSGANWTYTINIANFKLDSAYVVKIIGDYDLDDGRNGAPNMRTNQIIASKQFTASTLKSLGNVAFNTSIKSVTDHDAEILENINQYATQQVTMDLLQRVTFEIYRADDINNNPDASPVRTKTVIRGDGDFEKMFGTPAPRFNNILEDLDSRREYRIKIIPEVLIGDDYYELPGVNDVDTFYTKKQKPIAEIENGDLLAFTDTIYMFDVCVNDPDDAIVGGSASIFIVDGSLKPVKSFTVETNKYYDFIVPELRTGENYMITFIAPAFNDAFSDNDYTSYRTSARIETLPYGSGIGQSLYSERENIGDPFNCYKVVTRESISGKLTLRGMDVIKNDTGDVVPGYLSVKLRSEISDLAQFLRTNPKYTLRFYNNPGYGDYVDAESFEIDYPSGTWTQDMLDEQSIELPEKFNYKAELWVTVGDRAIMLDQAFFDTDGPMTPIFTTNQLRWLVGASALSGEDFKTLPINGGAWGNSKDDNTVPDGYGDGPMLTVTDTKGRAGRYLVMNDLYHWAGDINDTTVTRASEAGYDIDAIRAVSGEPNRNVRGSSAENPNSGDDFNIANGPFEGVLDFQGHKLIWNTHTSSVDRAGTNYHTLIYRIGYDGVVKNMQVEYGLTGENPGTNSYGGAFPIYTSRGKVQNVQVKVVKTNNRYNVNLSGLMYSNGVTGIIDNFTVDLGEGVTARSGYGGIVYSNSGIVRNGYVYGSESGNPLPNYEPSAGSFPSESPADAATRTPARVASRHGRITVPIAYDPKTGAIQNETFTSSNIGGAVGVNNATGRISNVYSLVDIFVNYNGVTGRTIQPQSHGSVVGINNGRVDKIYSVGEAYYNTDNNSNYMAGIHPTATANNYVYGPGMGSASAAARTANSYYVTSDHDRAYKGTWGIKTAEDTLYDLLWQQRIMGSSFDVAKTVTAGYFPQLIQPYNMPVQPFLPLPEIPPIENVEISSIFIEKQMQDYAIALATVKNKAYFQLRSFSIGGLTATVIPGTQIDNDGISRVQVRLDNPSQYKSTYILNAFSYGPANNPMVSYAATANIAVDAEFYKLVKTVDEWTAINNDKTWNYRLANDLDFSGVAPSRIMIGAYTTTLNDKAFTGKIDGGYYDEDYNLIGYYRIKDIDLSPNNVTGANTGVIPTLWGGAVTNLLVEGLNITVPDCKVAGFINYTSLGAMIDNVHIRDSYTQSIAFNGTLVSILYYSDITNCTVNNAVLRDATKTAVFTTTDPGIRVGGLVSTVDNASSIKNSYVFGVDILVANANEAYVGIGGFAGRFISGEIGNVYVQGRVKVTSAEGRVGGLVGVKNSANAIIYNCWTDVNISVEKDQAGGLAGYATETTFTNLNALILGDIDTQAPYPGDNPSERTIRRVIGTTGGVETTAGIDGPVQGSFVYDGQRIATIAVGDPSDQGCDGATMVSLEELSSKDYYVNNIHLGDAFVYESNEFADVFPSYGGVAEGNLPILKDTYGGLLPYQTARKPGEHLYSINVQDSLGDGATWEIVLQVKHPVGANIKSFEIDNIHIGDTTEELDAVYDFAYPSPDTTLVLMTLKRNNFLKFIDTYAITGVIVEDPDVPGTTKTEIAASKIMFDDLSAPYLRISSAAEWCELMTATAHGQSNENIEITGTLDFTVGGTLTSDMIDKAINVKVNRIKGQPGKTVIKNLTYEFSETGMGFIKYANALIQDFSFENITLTQAPVGGQNTGIISECGGTVLRVDFTNIDLKLNAASRAGAIGYIRGKIQDVTMKNVKVDARSTAKQTLYPGTPYETTGVGQQTSTYAQHVGGLVGYAVDSEISGVDVTYSQDGYGVISMLNGKPVKDGNSNNMVGEYDLTLSENPNIVMGRYMVGSIGGGLYSTRISDCSVEYSSVYGEFFNVTNSEAGRQSAGNSYIGGLAGYCTGTDLMPRNENLRIKHTRVINDGAITGGVFGQGLSYSTVDAPTTVDSVIVIGAGANVGGFTGIWYSTTSHVEVSNVKVFGRSNIGGIGGTTSTMYTASVRDSVVGSIFDNAGSTDTFWTPQFVGDFIHAGGAKYPNTLRMSRSFASYPAYNKYIGGIGGTGRTIFTSSVNNIIGAEGADYVGGGVGSGNTGNGQGYNQIMNTKVYGRDYIGGITGYQGNQAINNNVSNADVVGTGDYVGGVAGYIKPTQALDGASLAATHNNIIAGSVRGKNYVGGLVGRTEGNLYAILGTYNYYYANPHANITPTNAANNTSLAISQSITLDRDSFFLGKVKATGTGPVYASLLYNLDENITTNLIKPMGQRIWEYSVLDVNGVPKYAKDLMDGAKPVYKYASKDGEYLATTLEGRNDGRGVGPDFTEEPLYSTSNLLLTRQHFLGTYSDVGINFAYSVNPAPQVDPTTGLVTNWDLNNSYMKSGMTVTGSPNQTAGGAGTATSVGGAGGIAYTRQVWRANSGLQFYLFWYEGFRSGYLPYASNPVIYSYNATGAVTAYSTAYAQAPFSEGKNAQGEYFPTANTPFVNSSSSLGRWEPVTGTSRVSPGTNYFLYNNSTTAYTGHWQQKHFNDSLVDRNYSGGIPIPADPDGAMASFALADSGQTAPEATIYAVSADKISVDFENYFGGGSYSLIDSNNEVLYSGSIEKQTYTFTYDFKKKLTLITGINGVFETYEIDPSVLMRTISVYGDDWYHLSGGGIYAGGHEDGALIEGAFVNIINGEALNTVGEVYNIATGNVVRTIDEVELLEESIPLVTSEWEGAQINTFANYSVTSTGEMQPLRLYSKNGKLAAIDPNMPLTVDALILDHKENETDPTNSSEIMTVLGLDGVIADIKEPIKLPDDFRTDFVREMSSSINSDLTVAMVRYKSGRVAAFDYMTGEAIPLQSDKGEGSIIAYARTVISDNASSMFETLSGSYSSLLEVEAQIRRGNVPSDNAGTKETSGTASDDGESTGGEEASGAEGELAEGEQGTGVTGEQQGIDGTDGDGELEASATQNIDVASIDGADGGADVDDGGSTDGDDGVEADGDESATEDGSESSVDLSRPAKTLPIVSVYDMAEGKYRIYDAGSLTSESNVAPIETVDLEEVDAEYMLQSMKEFGKQKQDKGLIILIVIAFIIALLLTFIAIKRHRLTK